MNLRKYARGKPCLVRLPGCDGGGETTVLAHFRVAGHCGIGIKPHDLAFGAWGCNHCHGVCDGRIVLPDDVMSSTDIRLAHAIGCMRTVEMLAKDGVIKW